MLFGREENKENTLKLFNALNGTSYSDPNDITFTTIDGPLYLGCKNDVSFIIESEMSLYEQQSTINPNMPLRGIMYYGKIMDAYTSMRKLNIYGESLIKIPTPKYYVFYNGLKNYESQATLKLSDSFMTPEKTGGYEWTATVINLNDAQNKDLLDKCKPLADYTELVRLLSSIPKPVDNTEHSMDKYAREIDQVIDDCIQRGILTNFLIKTKAEVRGMILEDYGMKIYYDDVRNVAREEGREEGLEEGQDIMSRLILLLTEDGRIEELKLAAKDADKRKELIKEYHLDEPQKQ